MVRRLRRWLWDWLGDCGADLDSLSSGSVTVTGGGRFAFSLKTPYSSAPWMSSSRIDVLLAASTLERLQSGKS